MIYKNLFARKIISFLIISAMILILFPRIPVSADVQANWNGHIYARIENSMTWKEAKAYCEKSGGHLATITSEEEQRVVERLISHGEKAQYWLGGSDEVKEGEWKWVTGEPWTYWATTVTFNNYQGNEHYLQIIRHHWGDPAYLGGWNDINNENYINGQTSYFSTDNIGFICEWDDNPNNNGNSSLGMSASEVLSKADIRHFNGHSYLIISEKTTPVEAEKFCREMGGYLVTVNSQEENEFLKKIFDEKKEEGYILGGSDREVEGQWKWMTGEPWNFEYWNSGIEPNDGLGKGEDYVFAARNVDWKWIDFFGGYDNYSSKFAYICEFNTMIGGAGQNTQNPQISQNVSDTWTGTWSAEGVAGNDLGIHQKIVYYIEQVGNYVYITYYQTAETAKNGVVYGSIKGVINPHGSITGLNWFDYRVGNPDRVVEITKNGKNLKIVRANSSGTYMDTLFATKISDLYPKDKMFAGNKNADLGNANPDIGQYSNTVPTPNNAVPVPVESKNGANPTLVFNGVTGVSINSPINRGYLGYRVFRSENEYDLGISVTDFYITSENFTDVNVEPNTTYYYTLKPVISEANPLQNKKEQLGDAIAKWRVTTANSLGTNFRNSNGMRHFIMLKINDPKMSVDGVMQEVDPGKGTTPIIVKGRTMVPIRAIVEAMGGNVGWENSRREVSLSVQGIDVKMWIDKKELIKNSRHTKIDVAPSVINGRTFVPLRFAAENLDCQVDWINSTKSVVIVWSE